MPVLLILFIAIPVAEIATFIQVGDIIGLFSTISIIILTAIIGSTLVRYQGLEVFSKFKENIETGKTPVVPALHGLCLLVSGLLLITPGFLTDTVGFLLLIPQFREKLGLMIWEKIKNSSNIHIYPDQNSSPFDEPITRNDEGPIIEGEVIVENVDSKPNPKSKWAKQQDNSEN